MPISGRRPFSEIFEVTQTELVREAASGEEAKYKGFVNQVYTNELPDVLPETYIKRVGRVLTFADYTTGTVTVGTGTTNIVGVATSWSSTTVDNYWIRVSGYNNAYRVSFSVATSLTFRDSFVWTESSGSGLNYTLYQDRYALPSAFAYMVKDHEDNPNVVYRYINGVKIFLNPWTNEEYDRQFTATIGSPHAYTVRWVSGSAYLLVQSNPDIVENIGFDYIPVLTQLREHTTGTATLTTGTSLVLTSNARITSSLNTARTLYFRNDADGTGSNSLWHQISTVTNDSVATLNSAYIGISSGTGQTYTISEISEWPSRFDDAILYKAALLADPDGTSANKWLGLYQEALRLDVSVESKRTRTSEFKHFPGRRK